jgi:hypothetical protein
MGDAGPSKDILGMERLADRDFRALSDTEAITQYKDLGREKQLAPPLHMFPNI